MCSPLGGKYTVTGPRNFLNFLDGKDGHTNGIGQNTLRHTLLTLGGYIEVDPSKALMETTNDETLAWQIHACIKHYKKQYRDINTKLENAGHL